MNCQTNFKIDNAKEKKAYLMHNKHCNITQRKSFTNDFLMTDSFNDLDTEREIGKC